ncbi:Aspartate racemase [Penicillium concentricum]|uniref:Aspartate racemase n=1 Tax=Penicillium concentricum TaxID=293559 RepID=A0A9W9SQM5_9EURO|nr:Aspartate racemase [Penicillium concentricum]KAJ5382335.1 Aspartate racemase [Penicillium concentricum]
MKTIGICIPTIEGGVIAHQEIGREAARRGIAYPQIVTHTPIYGDLEQALKSGDNKSLIELITDSINRTAKAGAEFAIISANTPHIVFDDIVAQSNIPVLSILDVTANHCKRQGYNSVGVLGTTWTVKSGLYNGPLQKRGMAAVYASDTDQAIVMDAILHELINGTFLEKTSSELVRIAKELATRCDGIILGCTELPLILTEQNCGIEVVDTTRLLSHAALDFAKD